MRKMKWVVIVLLALLFVAFIVTDTPVDEPWPRSIPPPRDLSGYNEAQLSWIIEGLQEQISELQDELARVIAYQMELIK